MELNKICKIALDNAEKRANNNDRVSIETSSMLKHCATEVMEAMEAYVQGKMCECDYTVEAFENELADIVCCVMIISAKENIDLEYAIYNCIEKNRRRALRVGDKL